MEALVAACHTKEDALGIGIEVGCALAHQIRQPDQPFAAGRGALRLLSQQVIGIAAGQNRCLHLNIAEVVA